VDPDPEHWVMFSFFEHFLTYLDQKKELDSLSTVHISVIFKIIF
jgi:hypothetical protein